MTIKLFNLIFNLLFFLKIDNNIFCRFFLLKSKNLYTNKIIHINFNHIIMIFFFFNLFKINYIKHLSIKK